MSDEGLFLTEAAFLLCPHKKKRANKHPQASFVRALILLMRPEPSQPNHLRKTPTLNILQIAFQHMDLGDISRPSHPILANSVKLQILKQALLKIKMLVNIINNKSAFFYL